MQTLLTLVAIVAPFALFIWACLADESEPENVMGPVTVPVTPPSRPKDPKAAARARRYRKRKRRRKSPTPN